MVIKAICDGCKKEIELGPGCDSVSISVDGGDGHAEYQLCKDCYKNARTGIRDIHQAAKDAGTIIAAARKVAGSIPLDRLVELLEGKDIYKVDPDLKRMIGCCGYTLIIPYRGIRRNSPWQVRCIGYDAPPSKFASRLQEVDQFVVCDGLTFYGECGGKGILPHIVDRQVWGSESHMVKRFVMKDNCGKSLSVMLADTKGLKEKRSKKVD